MKKKIMLSIVSFVFLFGCTKEETDSSSQPPQEQFDGTIIGKWKVIKCPEQWSFYKAEYVVFSKNKSFMSNYPSNDPIGTTYKTWYQDSPTELSIGGEIYTVSQKGLDNVTLTYINSQQRIDTTYLNKLSNDQCPDITSIEKDPKGTNSLIFQGNPEFIPKSEIITNMEILSYYQDKGLCFFGTPLTNPTNYITFSRNGCPTISYKLELGIWKKQ